MLLELFEASDRYSVKWNSYFRVYEGALARFIGKGITFVEVGASTGASLLMWKTYFQNARVIGIDNDLSSAELSREGVEMFIGDQASPQFWETFYKTVGPIDVLLDDGGHTNEQQIVTVSQALAHVRDDGVILVEDVHASYMDEFLNPSPYSFINFAKHLVDSVNSRAPFVTSKLLHRETIASLEFHESIVIIHVDRRLSQPHLLETRGVEPLWPKASLRPTLRRRFKFARRIPFIGRLGAYCLWLCDQRRMNRRLSRHFSERD